MDDSKQAGLNASPIVAHSGRTHHQSQSQEICATLYKFYMAQELCDITLKCGVDHCKIACHRLILCAASPYFKALLAGPLSRSGRDLVTIEAVTGATLRPLITFFYTGIIHIDDDCVDELIGAASMLQCHRVESMCADYLLATLDTTNCLGLWQLAVQYELVRLKKMALQLVLDDFDEVIATHEFYLLRVQALEMLLANDSIFVSNEGEVFEAIVRWIQYDELKRMHFFSRLLTVLRLSQLKWAFLVDRVRFCCDKWHFPFNHVLEMRQIGDGSTARISARHPVLLSVGGNGLEDSTVDQFIIKRYNYLKQKWQVMHSLAGYRFGHCAIHVGEYLYIFGGRTGKIWDADTGFLSTALRLHLRSWKLEVLPPMLTARHFYASIVHVDGFIYVMGGDATTGVAFERYDIEHRVWTELKELPIDDGKQVFGSKLAVNAGQIYAIGGFSCGRQSMTSSMDDFIDRVASYSSTADDWSELPAMHKKRMHHLPFVYDGQLHVIGGDIHFLNRHTMEIYDSATESWHFVDIAESKMPAFVKVASLQGKYLYLFGYSNFNRDDPQLGYLDMTTMAWTKLTAVAGQMEDDGKLIFVSPYDPAV